MNDIQKLEKIIKTSNSSKILHNINIKLPRHFHEHSHVLYDIRTLLGDKQITYLEIGSYIGSSAALILQHPYKTNVICVDPLNLNPNHYNGKKSQAITLRETIDKYNTKNYNVAIHQALSTSPTLLTKLKGIHIDLLFIDGDHRYEGVINDWNNFEPLVKSGGFIVFDDYLDARSSPQVKRAVDDIVTNLSKNKYKIIGSLPNYQKAYSKIPKTHSNEFIIYKL